MSLNFAVGTKPFPRKENKGEGTIQVRKYTEQSGAKLDDFCPWNTIQSGSCREGQVWST